MKDVIDRLKRISEIAAKNASESFSKIVNKKVLVKSLNVTIKKIKKINEGINLEEIVAGVHLQIKGKITGEILLVLPKETALIMSDLLLKKEAGITRKLNSLDESALKEVGNIVAGAYLAVLSNVLQVEIIAHVPNFKFDMFGAIYEQVANKLAKKEDDALVIDIEFIIKSKKLKGYLLLLFAFAKEKVISALSMIEKG